jgi:hypothetical protein
MSRYLILLLLNIPFILAAILASITQYKLKHISRRKFIVQTCLWLIILIGLILAEPLYTFLFSNNLTTTEPLSLFDVVQITAIVVVFYISNRTRVRLESTERRLHDLHQELSIRLSAEENK